LIEVNNIYKYFGEIEVLKDISCAFERGKNNLIIGASGSGKSVLVKCIVGLHNPSKGHVRFDDRDYTAMNFRDKKEIRKEIGMLFQGTALFDSMTVGENVLFPLRMHTNMDQEEMNERVNFCLKRVELENVNDLLPSELSGGMQKRVGIARAIALNPKYLICDEPNSGLDPQTSIVIDNLISEITKEFDITTITVTHDMNSVMEVGDQVIFIYKGQKWWVGDNKNIMESDNKELNDFVYASRIMKRVKKG